MTPSENCLNLAKQFEGCRLESYQDPMGVWTVGYGCTGPEIGAGVTWTQDQADAELMRRMDEVAVQIESLVKVPLTQNQFDALCDFTYNLGIGNLQSSTLLRLLNMGQYDRVPAEMARWDKAGGEVLPGLVKRRAAEGALWRV